MTTDQRAIVEMVPRGGIEPPTLRFSITHPQFPLVLMHQHFFVSLE